MFEFFQTSYFAIAVLQLSFQSNFLFTVFAFEFIIANQPEGSVIPTKKFLFMLR